MSSRFVRTMLCAIAASVVLAGCAKEVEQPKDTDENLHEVVFHASWDAETKTVLQEDGSVFWSPGDEISLFVKDESGYHGTGYAERSSYKLTSTNTEESATTEFVGEIGGPQSATSYFAIYPYQQYSTFYTGSDFTIDIPRRQVAREGTFDRNIFVCAAASDNDHLYFKNLCGGIKFSVANEGITSITIESDNGAPSEGIIGDYISGRFHVSPSFDVSWDYSDSWGLYRNIEIVAPDEGTFSPGKYYYVVIPALDYNGLKITYHKGNTSFAIFEEKSTVSIKKSVFKRLYNKDAELEFREIPVLPDSRAFLKCQILPDGIDKAQITEANFYTKSDVTTKTLIGEHREGYEDVYFEQVGSTVNYYTKGNVYELDWNAQEMFMDWKSLQHLDLSSFYTYNVEWYSNMFYGCSSLKELNISNFYTDKAEMLVQMFCNCSSLESLDVSNFRTENVRSFGGMFSGCKSLKTLDVSNFDTSNATGLGEMFRDCRNLRTLNLSNFVTSKVRSFSHMFFRCINLTSLDVSGFDMSSAEDTYNMFMDCRSLGNIDTHEWKSSHMQFMVGMFYGCRNITSLDLTGIDLSNVENVQVMFCGCNNLQDIEFSPTRTAPLVSWGIGSLFADCHKLKHVDMSHFDTSNVTSMQTLFDGCYNLETIDFGDMNTSNVTNMLLMFNGCSSLKELDLSGFDTRSLTNMERMFSSCSSLRELDLSNWNTSQVADMMYAFEGCRNLERLDISSFTSENLQQVWGLFAMTNKLSSIDMGNFDLSNLSSQSVTYKTGSITPHCYVRCSPATKSVIEQTSQDFLNVVWITDGSPLPADISSRDDSLYYSSDFSKDKRVRVVQKASKGNGIDIVLMGDCYSDRMISAGDYDRDMERTINSIFKHEPFRSFRDMFNIYIIYAVSANEIVEKSTAFGSHDDRSVNGGSIGADDIANIYAYSHAASGNGDQREVVTIVVINSGITDGAVRTFLFTQAEGEEFDYHNDLSWDDYHGGESIAFLSGPTNLGYEEVVIHELGHAFGKLADEYWYQDVSINEFEKQNLVEMFPYGLWKNIDVTGDRDLVKWNHFLSDSRYSNTGVGVYEGGRLYSRGVWRPSENSFMRDHSLIGVQFNAPSREAIYYRIHKLAYGKDWPYDYEAFVQWDQKNIEVDRAAMLAPRTSQRKASSISVRKPFFNISQGYGSKGQKGTVIIMD